MQNLLNGKNIDDIEFQPNTSANVKTEEFHFGPNAAPFASSKLLDQSEALSTKAVFGDESSASYMEESNISRFESTFADTDISVIPEFHPKTQDPMSTSFYQDREDDSNPFDLNKVQVLPENLDEFLSKSDETPFNDTISDLPSHNPLRGLPIEDDQVTDLDKPVASEEKTGDLLGDFQAVTESDSSFEHIASPVNLEQEAKSPFEEIKVEGTQPEEVCPRSPAPETEFCVRPQSSEGFGLEKERDQAKSPIEQKLIEDICLRPESQTSEDVCLRPQSKSPIPETESPAPDVCLRPESASPAPEVCLRPESASPAPEMCARPKSAASEPRPESASPVPDVYLLPESKSPLPEDICVRPESKSPVCLRAESKSPVPEAPSPAASDEICLPPEPEAPTPEPQGDICQRPRAITPEPESISPVPEVKSPELLVEEHAREEISEIASEGVTSPVEDITSSVKDEIASPVISPVPKETLEAPSESLDEKEVDSGVDSNESVPQVNLPQEILVEPVKIEEALIPELNSTPKSVISEATDSVVTADVNSVLEKCNLPDVASPLNTTSESMWLC